MQFFPSPQQQAFGSFLPQVNDFYSIQLTISIDFRHNVYPVRRITIFFLNHTFHHSNSSILNNNNSNLTIRNNSTIRNSNSSRSIIHNNSSHSTIHNSSSNKRYGLNSIGLGRMSMDNNSIGHSNNNVSTKIQRLHRRRHRRNIRKKANQKYIMNDTIKLSDIFSFSF